YNDKWNLLLRRDVDAVIKRYKELAAPELAAPGLVSKDALDKFTDALAHECSQRQGESRELEKWLRRTHQANIYGIKYDRHRECVGCSHSLPVIDHGIASILERLRKEGWAKELHHMEPWRIQDLSRLPVVRLPKPLTDAEWPKVMSALQATLDKARADLNAHIIRIGLRMRYSDLEDAIRKHCIQLPRTAQMMLHPKPIDFVFTPKCRTALERPLEFGFRAEDPLKTMAPMLVKRWNIDVKKKLTRYLRWHLRRIPAGVDPLNLAVAIFTCAHCTDVSRDCRGSIPVRNRYVPVRGLPRISAKCRVHPCQSALFRIRATIMSLLVLPLP
ncbi:hypothetical protein TRAPUB_6845, partial [Trametes pubescens]